MSVTPKHQLRRAMKAARIEVRRRAPGRLEVQYSRKATPPLRRDTMFGVLQNARSVGLVPELVVDVGAASGTQPLYEVFPDSRYLLIEPLVEFMPALRQNTRGLRCEIFNGVATSTRGEQEIFVHPDLYGSSIYAEEEAGGLNTTSRTVAAETVDALCKKHALKGSVLLKVDTQGAELDVLCGAEHTLRRAHAVLLETSLFPFFAGGSEIGAVFAFMSERGFAAYDIFDVHYRPLDGALAQADLMFVPRESPLRAAHAYADPAQRQLLTQQIRPHL